MISRKPSTRLKLKIEPFVCDQCRLNRVSCQAPPSVDERCGQCEQREEACTWEIGPRPLGRSPPSPSYIAYLESQFGKIEQKLREILPGVNLNRELETLAQGSPPVFKKPIPTHLDSFGSSTFAPSPSYTLSPPSSNNLQTKSPMLAVAPQLLKQVRLASGVGMDLPLPYARPPLEHPAQTHHRPLPMDIYWSATASTKKEEPRFHGQSSGEILLRDAKEFKQELVDLVIGEYKESESGIGDTQTPPKPRRLRQRRPQFWELTPPEQRAVYAELLPPNPSLELVETFGFLPGEVLLPPPDLLRSLVDLFFEYVIPTFPLFHRETFELELARGSHLSEVLRQRQGSDDKHWHRTDGGYGLHAGVDQTRGTGIFARVLLLVCACASRWSADSRVLSNGSVSVSGGASGSGSKGELSPLSAGYSFFRQVNLWNRPTFAQAGLWDVQTYVLAIVFLHGSSAYHSCWLVLGIGIRLAQDIGAHRRKETISIENELYKRTFWSLLMTDRMMSGAWGRPSAIQDIDIDLDNVIEVDDEHWPVGGQPAQPPGKPSRLSFLNCVIGLLRVLGRALQTIYAIDRTKRQLGLVGAESESMLLRDLIHHLKQWQLTVPPHLRLPDPRDFRPSVFLDQAVSIWSLYYHVKILIHRPFVAVESSPLRGECQHMCRSSARECAKILEGHQRLSESEVLPHTLQATFSCAMFLLVDILETKKAQMLSGGIRGKELPPSGASADEGDYPVWEREADVARCVAVLKRAETRWHFAGRLHDILREFQNSGHLPPGTAATSNTPSPKAAGPFAPSIVHLMDTFDLDFSPTESTLSPPPDSQANLAYPSLNTTSVNSEYPSFPPPPTHARRSHQYINTSVAHPEPTNTANFDHVPHSTKFTPSDPGNFIHPEPADPYQLAAGAYIPDAYYCGDSNVPFPGIIPGILFAPHSWREDSVHRGSTTEEA
ncbi:hypothetical protein BDV93DRAFT_524969 [Ceratobasidium sp. AG-I]|nr:hypothetical protein BDV93DRAFT_524969 [Ceratobasidium sp. AG-I]